MPKLPEGRLTRLRRQNGQLSENETPKFDQTLKIETIAASDNSVNVLDDSLNKICPLPPFNSQPLEEHPLKEDLKKSLPKWSNSESSVQLRTNDPWADWYVQKYGCEMGDAYEPDAMAVLDMFDLTEQSVIDPARVVQAGALMRSRGDRSFLSMMTPTTVQDWVWYEDPLTNQWSSRAKFPGE